MGHEKLLAPFPDILETLQLISSPLSVVPAKQDFKAKNICLRVLRKIFITEGLEVVAIQAKAHIHLMVCRSSVYLLVRA